MKKILHRICGVLLLLLLSAGLAACNGENGDTTNANANGDTNQATTNQPNDTTTTQPPTQQPSNQPADQPQTHTLAELSATIEAAGAFWEDFWALSGIFAWEHFDDTPWDYWVEQPMHPLSRGYQRVLPSFAFQSISEIGEHLRQFYTDEGVNREIFGRYILGDGDMFLGSPWAFEEYGEFRNLYVHTARIGQFRPDWTTATHTLLEQDGNHAVVETIVFAHDHMEMGVEMPTATFRFTFIDGRIDIGLGRWNEWDFPNMAATHDTHDPDDFHGVDPIAELEGTWLSPTGHTLTFPIPDTSIGGITRMPNGAFVIWIEWDGGGDSRVWMFPAGVEMVRYHWGWERMPYNPYVVSDTSVWRLFDGDFEVTSCCSDEVINATLYTRQR